MGFFTLLDVGTAISSLPTPTPAKLSNEQVNAVSEVVRGVFSEQMTKAVSEAPTDNFIVYAFLIIALVLIGAVVAILKISSNTTSKAVASSIAPYISQLQALESSFKSSQEVYERMATRFATLTEELVRFQTLRIGEEDRIEGLSRQFQDTQTRISDLINSLFTAFREHEKNSYERQIEGQKNNQNVKLALVEMRANCGVSHKRRVGEKLLEKGYISRVQLDEVLNEQTRELIDEI
jgi:hypothetical protein